MNARSPSSALTLPSNLEAEQALLGGLMIANGALDSVSGLLRPEHFSEPVHGRIYAAALALGIEARSINPMTLMSALPDDIRIGDYSRAEYLAHLAAAAVSAVNIPDYARVIVDAALRRELMALAGQVTDAASAGTYTAPLKGIVADAELRLMEIGETAERLDPNSHRGPEDFNAVLADAEDRMRSGRHFKGHPSGLAGLDVRIGGFAPGELIVLAARPSMGKSMLALSMARRMARIGVGVAFDSLEMSEKQVRIRLLSDEAESVVRVPYKSIAEGRIQATELEALRRAGERLDKLPLAIIDRGNRLGDLPGHIREARKQVGARGLELGVFILDYLGLVIPSDRYRGKRYDEVTEVSATLKALAKREGIAIIALHQLNRANEARDDKRPRLSDLRESGALEQDADVVMFVHREAYYLSRPGYRGGDDAEERARRLVDEANVMEVIIDKQRQGPTTTVQLWCDMALNAVRDPAR